MTHHRTHMKSLGLALGATALTALATVASADQVILDDLIVDGSLCVGIDCVNGESFGFDTIRLKENNLRIKFQDTSNSASFPTNDWQLTANDSSNGGDNKFSIDDIDGGRTPFTIRAGAPNHSLYVDAQGDVGINKKDAVVELHIVDGDSPTIRLEQDGSSGFTAQTWDLAGNEANFFVRDVTNGSLLPFKIKPGAPTSSLFIAADGDIGFGTESPLEDIHVRNSGNGENAEILLEAAGANGTGNKQWELIARGSDGEFAINDRIGGGAEFILSGPNATVPGLRIIGTYSASSLDSCANDAPILADGNGGLKC